MDAQKTLLVLGGDGYLGWSLGLAFGNRTDYRVVLVDNLIKREWEKEVNAKLLVPFKKPRERIAEYERIFGKHNLSFEKIELLDQEACARMLRKYRPFAIINAAQQPSAPFSMMNAKNSAATFTNNMLGHLNVLWAIAQTDKTIKYVKLGSAGCYMDVDTDFLPLKKVDFTFEHEGQLRKVLKSWFPMQATDFYHQSKISDFLMNDLCASVWNLRVLTVQQSTIFGATIEENRHPERHSLSTRFNYDAVFSTVLNRFVCQLAIGHPLTVYGDGSQTTGIISLADTVDHFHTFIEMDLSPGEHHVVHNYTHRLSIKEIAEALTAVAGASEVHFIENPRKEGGGSLKKHVEVHHTILDSHNAKEERFKNELVDFVEFTKRYKDNIDSSIILPKIKWECTEDVGLIKKATPKKDMRRAFFSYGTVGLMNNAAYKAASQFLEEFYRVGPPEVLYKYDPYVGKLKQEAAKLINCAPEEVTYIKNTTEGITIASEALPLKKGDEVIVGGNEYPANLLPWLKKKKDGVVVTVVKGYTNAEVFEGMLAAIGPRTKAISISWAQHYDGFLPDLGRLSKVCRKKGVFLVVDGVQGVGVREIDLKRTPVDFLVCGGQKYLGGFMGIGFIYVSNAVIPKLRDTKVGIRSMQRFDQEDYVLKDTAERFEDGTQNLLGIVALHAALRRINAIGIKTIEKKNLALLSQFKAILKEDNIPFIDHAMQSNILSLKIEDPKECMEFLKNNRVYTKAVGDVLRVSFTHESTVREFKYLVEKVREWMKRYPMPTKISGLTAKEAPKPLPLSDSETGL